MAWFDVGEPDVREALRSRFYHNHFANTLRQLAKHYRREALLKLQKQNNWINSFTSSEPDFTETRKEFFRNGSDCVNTLEYEERYVKFIYQMYEGIKNSGRVFSLNDYWAKVANERVETMKSQKEKVEKFSEQSLFWEEAEKAVQRRADSAVCSDQLFDVSYAVWRKFPFLYHGPPADDFSEEDFLEEFLEEFEAFEVNFKEAIASSHPWKSYKRNLRAFTYDVGCSKAHEEPWQNIAELRLFHSTQMPFFKKLQDDLEAQIKLNDKQQEIITALVFRYLTEQLPPSPYNGKTTSTDRWQEFWKDAIIKENADQTLGTHPLTSLHNELSGSKRVVDASGSITGNSQKGMKGNLYKTGENLFNTLSTNIHKYKGDKGGVYIVGDDQWGETCRELLRALVPKEIKDGEVDWDAERKRYI